MLKNQSIVVLGEFDTLFNKNQSNALCEMLSILFLLFLSFTY